MRRLPELRRAGFISRTHGYKGQLRLVVEETIKHEEWDWIFVEIDKKPVPFFVEDFLGPDDAPLVKLKGLENDQDASKLNGHSFFLPVDWMHEADPLPDLLNFQIQNPQGQIIGFVSNVIEGQLQDILVAQIRGQEVLIPWHEEFILEVDEEKSIVLAAIPQELIDLNEAD